MAKSPKTTPDRHYNFRGMNAVFAWSSLALLAVTLWMVFADYAKPWKRHQAEFRERERQMLLAEAETERQRLDENEIAQIQEDIRREEESLAGQREEIRGFEKQLSALGKKVYAADAAARTTKSELDTARYQLDVAMQGDSEARQQRDREEVEALSGRLREERKEFEAYTEERKRVEATLEEKRSTLEAAEKKLTALRGGLEALEQRVANLDKKIDYFVLNAPLMDFIEPNLKIEQVILSGLYQDINFTNVDRVDRCMTCHVAADRGGFDGDGWEQPLRSHPRLDLYLSATSPHPYTRFGCTTCHGGLDRATDFARAGHSPESQEERQQWIEKWDWEPQKYLDHPILPAKYSEAGCISCHAGNLWTPQSDLQDIGREIMMHTGCYVCHKIDYPAFETLPRLGPNLAQVAGKVEPGWAFKFITAPRDFRPTTWMPHFFFQPNTTTAENLERQKAEIVAAVSYLWEHSRVPEYPSPPAGDSARGKELFESVGCTGCHILEVEATRTDYYPQINRLHGPNLVRTGSKVSAGWLYAWIKDPKQYAPDTRMPSLRLTDQEAADITSYLMSQRDPAFENLTTPEVDPGVRDELVLSYLQNNLTIEQSQARLESMSARERDVYLGEETIQKYGCWGCHDLKGFELAKPIGVEITEHGSKPVHQFDFGHVQDVPHTRHDWIKTKLLEPRIWDDGKETVKSYGELYRMPNFGLSETEAEAVLVNVLGFTKESVLASRKPDQGKREATLAAGRRLISLYNCQACHLIEGAGQAIRTALEDVDQLPPNLAAEGARVQSDWLFEYLHDPGRVRMRPWLSVRMPTFGFSDEQINTLIAYFAALDDREPFLSDPDPPEERNLGVGRVTFNMLQCAKCHPAGPQVALATGAQAGELAPSLLLATKRLRHDWVPDWIKDPQSWIKGTKMPANFPKMADGRYQSPLAGAIDAPMFAAQKREMMAYFDSEDELKAFLADTDRVTVALRDHIWWNLPD
jgi:cytochrome c2